MIVSAHRRKSGGGQDGDLDLGAPEAGVGDDLSDGCEHDKD
jgi:hypothetical protein